jgi:hypothetical protein
MKPHIQRVFGRENSGIVWVCRGTGLVPLSGVGETPKDAYWSWLERDYMVSLNEEIAAIYRKRSRWPKWFG